MIDIVNDVSMQNVIEMIEKLEIATGKPFLPFFREVLIINMFVSGQRGYLYGYMDAKSGIAPKVTPEDLIDRLAKTVATIQNMKDDLGGSKNGNDKM